MRRAFTLIELLIVVAIIAILAAVAVPNFLEAQVRAKVSRTMADMQSYATAINTYRIDWNCYPLDGAVVNGRIRIFPTQNPSDAVNLTKFGGPGLTTPVAYLINQPLDPFVADSEDLEFRWYFYANLQQAGAWFIKNMGQVPPMIQLRTNEWGNWMMQTSGPDGDRKDVGSSVGQHIVNGYYDATNGTISNGDILRAQRMTTSLR